MLWQLSSNSPSLKMGCNPPCVIRCYSGHQECSKWCCSSWALLALEAHTGSTPASERLPLCLVAEGPEEPTQPSLAVGWGKSTSLSQLLEESRRSKSMTPLVAVNTETLSAVLLHSLHGTDRDAATLAAGMGPLV